MRIRYENRRTLVMLSGTVRMHLKIRRCEVADCVRYQSGRIEARTGLRMMPTSPRSPLSFRTAGFPQYGWKAGLSGGAFPDRQRLKPAPGMRLLSAGLPSPFVHHSVEAVLPY
jgi:hypothetical protein